MRITAKKNVVVVRENEKIIQTCRGEKDVNLWACVKCWMKAKLKKRK